MVLYNLILHKKYAKVGMKTSKGEQKMRKGVKVTALLLGAVLLLGLAACGKKNVQNPQTTAAGSENTAETTAVLKQQIKVAALKGPTAIGMVQLMENAKEQTAKNDYEFQIAATADEFSADLIKGNVALAALPCNAAATLYNKSNGKIRILGINTLGVLSILDTGDSVQTVADLKGKTVYTTGKGTTPEYTLRYLLSSAGLNPDSDVTIEFKSEAAEVAAVMANAGTEEVIAMLPQPYAATVLMQQPDTRIALDVTEEWEKLNGSDSTVVTGVLVVNTEFYKNNRQAVDDFLKEYKSSVQYVNSNVDGAAQLVEDFDIFKAAVAKKAIPKCNITLITGQEMQDKVEKYLKVLCDANPNAVGGQMPDDGFYVK